MAWLTRRDLRRTGRICTGVYSMDRTAKRCWPTWRGFAGYT